MRFLIDNALSPLVAAGLREAGHDAAHVRDYDIAAEEDGAIFERAAQENRILVSADTDFGTLLALRKKNKPSVILFRRSVTRRPEAQVALLVLNVEALETELERGCVASSREQEYESVCCRLLADILSGLNPGFSCHRDRQLNLFHSPPKLGNTHILIC